MARVSWQRVLRCSAIIARETQHDILCNVYNETTQTRAMCMQQLTHSSDTHTKTKSTRINAMHVVVGVLCSCAIRSTKQSSSRLVLVLHQLSINTTRATIINCARGQTHNKRHNQRAIAQPSSVQQRIHHPYTTHQPNNAPHDSCECVHNGKRQEGRVVLREV